MLTCQLPQPHPLAIHILHVALINCHVPMGMWI